MLLFLATIRISFAPLVSKLGEVCLGSGLSSGELVDEQTEPRELLRLDTNLMLLMGICFVLAGDFDATTTLGGSSEGDDLRVERKLRSCLPDGRAVVEGALWLGDLFCGWNKPPWLVAFGFSLKIADCKDVYSLEVFSV